MRGSLVIRAVAVAVALLVGGSAVRGDDREDRDRKARAALALTAPSAPAKSAAPKPRDVGTDYATAYARALDQSKPLVVYVEGKPKFVASPGQLKGRKAIQVKGAFQPHDIQVNFPAKAPAKPARRSISSAFRKPRRWRWPRTPTSSSTRKPPSPPSPNWPTTTQ